MCQHNMQAYETLTKVNFWDFIVYYVVPKVVEVEATFVQLFSGGLQKNISDDFVFLVIHSCRKIARSILCL